MKVRATKRRRNDVLSCWLKLDRSFVEARPIILGFLLPLPHQLLLAPFPRVLLVDSNIQDIDFIVDRIVDVFFVLVYEVLLAAAPDLAHHLVLPQLGLHRGVLLPYLVDHLQQLLYLKSLFTVPLPLPLPMQFLPQTVDLHLLLVDYAVLHLHQQLSTFNSFICYSFIVEFSAFRASIFSVR